MGGQTACVNWERMLAFRHARFDRQPRAIPTGAGLVQPAALERAGSSSAQDRAALRCLPQGQPDDAGDDRRSSSAASWRLECLSLRPAPIVVRLLSQPQRSQRSARLRLRHRRRRVLANEYRVKEATKSRLRVAKALKRPDARCGFMFQHCSGRVPQRPKSRKGVRSAGARRRRLS